MKKTITLITLSAMSLFLITACGGDNKSVTTKDLNCTADSYYDHEDEKWYLSKTDKRECKSKVAKPDNYGGNIHCPEGKIPVRIGSQKGSRTTTTKTSSNVYGSYGWSVSSEFCISTLANAPCHHGTYDIHNTRDRDRYHNDPVGYHSDNRSQNIEDYTVQCVDEYEVNNSDLFVYINGYWYYDFEVAQNSNLSDSEKVLYFGIGVLTGLLISNR